MIVKTLEELLLKGSKIGGEIVYPKDYVLQFAKEIRRLTLEEISNTAEVTVVDYSYLDDSIVDVWGVDSASILNLDLNTIQTW